MGDFTWAEHLLNDIDENVRAARKRFAQNACNGCHRETDGVSVVMIGDRSSLEVPSVLSKFVLLDLEARKAVIEKLLGTGVKPSSVE